MASGSASASSAPGSRPPNISQADLDSFAEHLYASHRILAICGAGLSAASGLPTFRGPGGLWRNHDSSALASRDAFSQDPATVWQFYTDRRHHAFKARPNRAHIALAELTKRRPEFLTITQNVDGLANRAGHPLDKIEFIHGSLTTIRCAKPTCDYVEFGNVEDPIIPALALPHQKLLPNGVTEHDYLTPPDISDHRVPLHEVDVEDLPHCPKCDDSLLRPGVVWFGEALPQDVVNRIDHFVFNPAGINLLLVIGTAAAVQPAASYINAARQRGARVAVINTADRESIGSQLQEGDWFFQGDAGEIVPLILEREIGPIPENAGRYM